MNRTLEQLSVVSLLWHGDLGLLLFTEAVAHVSDCTYSQITTRFACVAESQIP